jgi:cell division protein FtsB
VAGSSRRWLGPARPRLRRRFAALVAGAVLFWLGVMLVGGDSGALALFRARARLAEVEGEVRALEAANERLRRAIRRLQQDDREVERVAREELMMARPDEEVILVPDPKKPPALGEAPVLTP